MSLYDIILIVVIALSLLAFIRSLPAMLEVGPIPAHKEGIRKALGLARIKSGEKFYDLGCGDGRVLLEAVRSYDCRGVGYELLYPAYLIARARTWFFPGRDKIEIRNENIFKADVENADVIFCFLTPELMHQVAEFLKSVKLKKGVRVVSYAFAIDSMEPAEKIGHGKSNWNIYLYNFD